MRYAMFGLVTPYRCQRPGGLDGLGMLDEVEPEVAAGLKPFVALSGEHSPAKEDRRGPVREDPRLNRGAPEIPVEGLLRVVRSDLKSGASEGIVEGRTSARAASWWSATFGGF